jgi:hypothetical protein
MPDPGSRFEGRTDIDAADLAEIRDAMEKLADSEPQPSAPALEFTPRFADLESWVNGYFVLTFARPAGAVCWCEHWWDHAEAVVRLDALWRTWEAAALDPVGGVADWLRDYLDPEISVLFSSVGPFGDCRKGAHVRPPVLPVSPTPPNWWSAEHWWEMLAEPDR